MESLKKFLTTSYASLSMMDDMQDQKLVIVTPAGVIIGSPVSKEEIEADEKSFAAFSQNCAKDYREENSLPNSQRLDGNDGVLFLKDATLRIGSENYNFAFLNIFIDQIIAVTVGKAE